MKSFLLILAFIALCSCDDVLVATDKNFESLVLSAPIMLVEFYAPWCGHCKHLEPEYAKAATELKKLGIPLAKVDATVETASASKYGVQGYPTLKVFRKGDPAEYKGTREAAGIVSYMKKQAAPSYVNLATEAEVEAFINQPTASFIGFFSNKDSHTESIFTSAANGLRDVTRFGIVREKAVLEKYGYRQAIVVFRPQDDIRIVYGGSETSEALTSWAYDKAVPIVGEYNSDNAEIYNRKGLPILKLYTDVNWDSNLKSTMYYVNRLKKVAKNGNLYNRISFTLVNKGANRQDLDKFGMNLGKDDVGVVIEDRSSKYKMTTAFSVENIQAFIDDFLAGKLKNYVKSEKIPEKNDGPVTVVVGETFNDIVLDKSKDVLIEFYAPWCGHCKNLEPTYTELGKKIQGGYDGVVIAKMDATANDITHPKYSANGYPTIYLAPAGDKEHPIKFEGDRSSKGFSDFLKKNAKMMTKRDKEL